MGVVGDVSPGVVAALSPYGVVMLSFVAFVHSAKSAGPVYSAPVDPAVVVAIVVAEIGPVMARVEGQVGFVEVGRRCPATVVQYPAAAVQWVAAAAAAAAAAADADAVAAVAAAAAVAVAVAAAVGDAVAVAVAVPVAADVAAAVAVE